MGVFTFVCRGSGNDWTAKQLNGELEASASCTFELQRKLVQAALSSDSSGGVQSSFSYVSPSSGVFQVFFPLDLLFHFVNIKSWWMLLWIVFYFLLMHNAQVIVGGGGGGGAFIGGGGAAAPAASGGGAAAEAPAAEEKKEEKEESDDDMGFSLFD